MANWDNVDVDVGGDETINFGPRVEAGSALYQVDTLATVSARGKVMKVPTVHSCIYEDSFCLAADTDLSLFENGCHKLMHSMPFGSHIDCITHCGVADLLVVGERSGLVHIVDPRIAEPIFSQQLAKQEDGEGGSPVFVLCNVAVSDKGVCDMMVLMTNGKLVCFTNLQLWKLQKALQDKHTPVVEDIRSQVKMLQVDTFAVHETGTKYMSHLPSALGRSFVTAGSGSSVLSVWEEINGVVQVVQSTNSLLTQGLGIRKCLPVEGPKYLLCLDEHERLSLWSVAVLTIVKYWLDRLVGDFILVESGETNNLSEMQVVLLTQPERGVSILQVCHLPNLDVMYQLELSATSWLTFSPLHQDSVFVVEGVGETSEIGNAVSSLRIRCLTEALPETRFNRLLHKNRFEEAEQFAKLFDLDVELVYKVKANHLLEQLSPWNVDQLGQDEANNKLHQLQDCLELIQDVSHIVDSCVRSALPTLEATMELLTLARNRLSESMAETKPAKQNAKTQALYTELLETMHRLGTFQVAFGANGFTGAKWEHFQKANMLDEFLQYLTQGELEQAFSIWNRHQSEFDETFSCEVVENILLAVPQTTPTNDLRSWLQKEFIPYIIGVLPDGLSLVAAWLEKRARQMEVMEKAGWPQNAIEFCGLLQSTCVTMSQAASERGFSTADEFATQICNLSVGYSQVEKREKDADSANEDAFASLHLLILQLKDLANLHLKYDCRLSLAEYVQESMESLTFCMLDRVVAVELIPSTIQTVVKPYMREHGLNEDKMLFRYVEELTKRLGRTMATAGEAPWEAKATAIIGCIQDAGFKCSAILDMMRTAYIPWTADMQMLVEEGLALDHSSVEKLRSQYKLMELQKLLATYGLRGFYVANTSTAETLLQHIICKDRPTALHDALEVAEAFDKLERCLPYRFQMDYFICQNRVQEAIDLVRNLPQDLACVCGTRLVINTQIKLNQKAFGDEKAFQAQLVRQCQASCAILKYLLTLDIDVINRQEFEIWLKELTSIHALQVEFGEFVLYEDYICEDFRKEFLVRILRLFYTKQARSLPSVHTELSEHTTNRSHSWSYTKIYRISELLGVSVNTLQGQMALTAAEQGEAEVAIKKTQELLDFERTPETGRMAYLVAHTLSKHLASKKLPSTSQDVSQLSLAVRDLAKEAVTLCEPALLADCLALCRTTDMAYDLCRQCESGDYGLTVQKRPGATQAENPSMLDPYETWIFDDFYNEGGLVMDSAVLTPLAYEYVLAVLPEAGPLAFPYTQNRMDGQARKDVDLRLSKASPAQSLAACTEQLSIKLLESRQLQLALQYQVYSLSVGLQHRLLTSCGSDKPGHSKGDLITSSEASRAAEVDALMESLLGKMCKQKRLDSNLALGYLLSVQEPFANLQELLDSAGRNHKKMLAFCQLAVDFAESTFNFSQVQRFKTLSQNAQWAYTLAKLKIPFKRPLQGSEATLRNMLPALVSHRAVNLDQIIEFCNAYGLNVRDAIYGYIQHLLAPRLSNRGQGEGAKADSTTPPLSEVLEKASRALDFVDKTGQLWERLSSIMEQLDMYDYERLVFVIERMEEIRPDAGTEKKLKLLNYLMSYERVTPPGQYELDYRTGGEEEEVVCGCSALSSLAKTRLPYHPLVHGEHAWKIISPELNASSLSSLLGITDILQLARDQVYVITVKNIVEKHVDEEGSASAAAGAGGKGPVDKASCNWRTDDSQTQEFFGTVAEMLLKVSDCEIALACGNWIVRTLPMGSEKVLALKAVVCLAQKWLDACSLKQVKAREKATATLDKFTSFYRRLSTEQVLFQHKLGQENLLNLCNKPNNLLLSLYSHESILKRVAGTSIVESLPDIHEVADRVAEIYEMDMEKVRIALVDKWLPSCQQKVEDLDLTMTFHPTMNMDTTVRSEEEIGEDEVNLKRVTYILQHGHLEQNALFLLNFAFHKPSRKVTNVCRVRALRCLFSLVDKATIERLGHMTVEEIRESMKTWLYLVELERLQIPETMASFDKCNKEGLVKGIWRNHSHERRAVRLAADLCLDYEIYDAQLWNSMLQQLLAFGMLEYLRHVLVYLSGIPALWHVDCIQMMWKTVLQKPLTAVPPLSEGQLDDCLSSFALLHRCPMLLDLDLVAFSQLFLRLELYTSALGCLLLLADVKMRNQEVSKLLCTGLAAAILNQISEWLAANRSLPMIQQLKQTLFEHIDRTQQYACIGENHLAELANYMVARGDIDRLLVHGLQHNRVPQAIHLVTVYQDLHPDAEVTRAIQGKSPAPTPLKQLLIYIEMNGLQKAVGDHLPELEDMAAEDEKDGGCESDGSGENDSSAENAQ